MLDPASTLSMVTNVTKTKKRTSNIVLGILYRFLLLNLLPVVLGLTSIKENTDMADATNDLREKVVHTRRNIVPNDERKIKYIKRTLSKETDADSKVV